MTMKIGGLDISSMEFNGKSVESVWWGSDLVWGGVIPDIMLDYFKLPLTTENFIVTDGEVDLVPYADVVEYTGSEVFPVIHGYVPGFMTKSGKVSAVNKGVYTATLTLPTGYYFKSTGTASINVNWEIVYYYDVVIETDSSPIGTSSLAYVTVNGTTYHNDTLHLIEGTSVIVITSASNSSRRADTYITLDGTTVATGTSSAAASYTLIPSSNVNIHCQSSSILGYGYGYVDITST